MTENSYTNPVETADIWRTPLVSETRTYELVKVSPNAAQPLVTNLFRFDELQMKAVQASDGTHDLPYEDSSASGAVLAAPYRRLVEDLRMVYRKDNLSGPLGPGILESRGSAL